MDKARTLECPYCSTHLHLAVGQNISFCICGSTVTIDIRGEQSWTKPGRHSITTDETFQKIKQHRKDSGS